MPKKRILSEFMARELMFDYLRDSLSRADRDSFEEALKEYASLKEELRQIQSAKQYCKSLAEVEVTPGVFDEAMKDESFFKAVAGWYMGSAPMIKNGVPAIILLFILIISLKSYWKKVDFLEATKKLTLVRLNVGDTKEALKEIVGSGAATPTPLPEATTPFIGPTLPPHMVAATSSVTTTTQVVAAQPTATPKATTSTTLVVAAKPTTTPLAATTAASATGAESGRGRGFVYRAYMFTAQIDNVAPSITQKIKTLGGDKAGEVELGWKRKGGRYFHFWIPEPGFDDFMKYIRSYGPVRIQKDLHQRVMPQGQIRFILWVEDTASDGKTPSEEPEVDGNRADFEPDSKPPEEEGKKVAP